jgi:hypothetical protein
MNHVGIFFVCFDMCHVENLFCFGMCHVGNMLALTCTILGNFLTYFCFDMTMCLQLCIIL